MTGPDADAVESWQWYFDEADGDSIAAPTGKTVDVTFERAVAHKVSLTVTVTGDETVSRHFKVRPSVEGTVVNIYPSERPVPVGKEVIWRADLHMPTGHEPTVDETPTWTLRKADGPTEVTTRPRRRTNIVTISRTSRANQRGNLSTPTRQPYHHQLATQV